MEQRGVRGSIQNDVGLYGDPAIILGEGGALDFILAELRKVDLRPMVLGSYCRVHFNLYVIA